MGWGGLNRAPKNLKNDKNGPKSELWAVLGGLKTYRKSIKLQVLYFSVYIKRLRGQEQNSEIFLKITSLTPKSPHSVACPPPILPHPIITPLTPYSPHSVAPHPTTVPLLYRVLKSYRL